MSVLDFGKRLFWHFLGDIWDLSNSNKKRFTCRAASTWPNSSSRGMESIMLTLNLPFAFPSSLPPESSHPSRGDRFPHTAVQELLAQADYSETLGFTWATLPLPHTMSLIQLGLVCLSSAEAAEARSAFFSRDFSHSTVFNLLFSFLNVNKIFLFILESGHAERARGWWPRQPPSHWSAHPHTHNPVNTLWWHNPACGFRKLHNLSKTRFMQILHFSDVWPELNKTSKTFGYRLHSRYIS